MMKLERLQQIIDSYGCNDARWPTDERQAALEFVRTASDARQLLQRSVAESRQLDSWLSRDEVSSDVNFEQRVMARILGRVTNNAIDRKLDSHERLFIKRIFTGLLPGSPMAVFDKQLRAVFDKRLRAVWRPALAACLPLVIGILLGTGSTLNSPERLFINSPQDNAWDEELYLLALTDQPQWSGDWPDE